MLISPTLLILVLAFGALVAAVLPLIVGFLAIVVSLTIIGFLAHITPMSVFVLNMTTMIGLGVGIDYSLLVVTRFREELGRGKRRREAAVATMLTAGTTAVVTSGLTVVVGFGALLFTPLVETRSVGLGGLVVVAVAVLLSTTLLPALLAIMGRSIERPAGSRGGWPGGTRRGSGKAGRGPSAAIPGAPQAWAGSGWPCSLRRCSGSGSGCPPAIGGPATATAARASRR